MLQTIYFQSVLSELYFKIATWETFEAKWKELPFLSSNTSNCVGNQEWIDCENCFPASGEWHHTSCKHLV